MVNDYTLALSFFDFVPNIAFFIGALFLNRWVRIKGTKLTILMMLCGSILVFSGGLLKAIWKLLYTLDLGDYVLMSESQFVLLAPGFILMLNSALGMVEKKQTKALASMATWKIPFLALMTIGSLGLHATLIFIASHKRSWLAVISFLVSILCMLSMAGMASMEQSIRQQWIEQGVNSLGQVGFAAGSYLLYVSSRLIGAKTKIP
jgi:hypothetical protein